MFALLSNIASAQFCGTPESLVDNLWSPTGNTIAQGSLDGACINVYFHSVRNTNQSGGASLSQTDDIMNSLNDNFNIHGIFFNRTGLDYVDDYQFNNFEQ
jgi:hypothetical protein